MAQRLRFHLKRGMSFPSLKSSDVVILFDIATFFKPAAGVQEVDMVIALVAGEGRMTTHM